MSFIHVIKNMATAVTNFQNSFEIQNPMRETQLIIDSLTSKVDKYSYHSASVVNQFTHIDLDNTSGNVVDEDVAFARIYRNGAILPRSYRSAGAEATIVDYAKLGKQCKKYTSRGVAVFKMIGTKGVQFMLELDAFLGNAYQDLKMYTGERVTEFRERCAMQNAERMERLELHTLRLEARKMQERVSVTKLEVAYTPIIRRIPITYTVRSMRNTAQNSVVKKRGALGEVLSILYAELVHGTGFSTIDTK